MDDSGRGLERDERARADAVCERESWKNPREARQDRPLPQPLSPGRCVADGGAAQRTAQGRAFPAFGHPLYADGDPRASALLSTVSVPPLYAELAACVEKAVGERPNVDFALARCAGWLAHALERTQTGHLIRPRARYVGLPPKPAQ